MKEKKSRAVFVAILVVFLLSLSQAYVFSSNSTEVNIFSWNVAMAEFGFLLNKVFSCIPINPDIMANYIKSNFFEQMQVRYKNAYAGIQEDFLAYIYLRMRFPGIESQWCQWGRTGLTSAYSMINAHNFYLHCLPNDYKWDLLFRNEIWNQCAGLDCGAGKGFSLGIFEVKLENGLSQYIHIYNLHMQSSRNSYITRSSQFLQLAAAIELYSKNVPVIIVGDFNIYEQVGLYTYDPPYDPEDPDALDPIIDPADPDPPLFVRFVNETAERIQFLQSLGFSMANNSIDERTYCHRGFMDRCDNTFDFIFFRGLNNVVDLRKVLFTVLNPPRDTHPNFVLCKQTLKYMSDHKPVKAKFNYSLLPNAADLVIDNIELQNLDDYGNRQLSVTITNKGGMAAPYNGEKLALYVVAGFRSNQPPGPGDENPLPPLEPDGQRYLVDEVIAPNQTKTIHKNVFITPKSKSYDVYVAINQPIIHPFFIESDYSNNTFHKQYEIDGNISVTNPSKNDVLYMGNTYDITWTAENVRDLRIGLFKSNQLVNVKPSIPETIPPASGKYSWKVPMHLQPGNDYYISIFTETNDGVLLQAKSDNFTIAERLSDVVITNIILDPANPFPGERVSIKATIKNIGQFATPEGIAVGVGFRINGKYLGHYFVGKPLQNNESFTGVCNVQWKAELGTHKIWAKADDVDRFRESNENNNVSEVSVNIAARPTITVTSPGAGANWTIGKTYNITWTRSGVMDANVKIRLFDEAGVNQVLRIVNSTPNNGSFRWTVPQNLSAGRYRIRVRTVDNLVLGNSGVFTVKNDQLKDILLPGDVLFVNQEIRSQNNVYAFKFQSDGNLVLYNRANPIWASHTYHGQPFRLAMQHDGNLVLYSYSGPVWASHTWGNPGAFLAIQNDGNAVIYTPGGVPIWATGTSGMSIPLEKQ